MAFFVTFSCMHIAYFDDGHSPEKNFSVYIKIYNRMLVKSLL
jgi:hypothetical protein